MKLQEEYSARRTGVGYFTMTTAYAAGALGDGFKFVVLLRVLMGAPRVSYRAQGNEH